MQRDQSKITGLQKPKSNHSVATRLDVRNANTTINTFSPKAKASSTSRLTMIPPSLNASTLNLRKLELENNNLELELMYSDYIASYTEILVEKKMLKDAEDSFCNLIKSVYEETKLLEEKYKLLQIRLNDIKALSFLTDSVEVFQINVKEFKDSLEKYKIMDILSQLEKLLNRFNILCCKNITLPLCVEEVHEFKKTLSCCYNILQQISGPFKYDTLDNFTAVYEEFIKVFNEISNVKKIIEEKVFTYQLETLKACSHTLAESDI